jgi:hypothetical protein
MSFREEAASRGDAGHSTKKTGDFSQKFDNLLRGTGYHDRGDEGRAEHSRGEAPQTPGFGTGGGIGAGVPLGLLDVLDILDPEHGSP